MAVLTSNYATLLDWANRVDPDGSIPVVVDLMSQTNEVIDDIPWVEGNLTDGYKTSVRTGIPQGTWRMLYQGVQPSKSSVATVTERTGMLEGFTEVDAALADLNGNTAAWRMSEDAPFFEGMSQQMAEAIFYSNSKLNPEQILGLAPRYASLSASVPTSANIIDAGGTGSDNTSIWLVGWGPNTAFGIFPKGQKAGLTFEDIGKETKNLADGSLYRVYRSHFKWNAGLCVRDWRFIVRIANIDVSDLVAGNTAAANLVVLLAQAVNRTPTAPRNVGSQAVAATRPSGLVGQGARFFLYCNRTVRTALETQVLKQPAGNTQVLLRLTERNGETVLDFRGIPFRTVDKILNTEARIT